MNGFLDLSEGGVEYIIGDKIYLEGWAWRRQFPNFQPKELASPDNGFVRIYAPALHALQRVRKRFLKPMPINSAYRSPDHNADVGGSVNSQHLYGKAFDIALASVEDAYVLEELALEEGFTAIGRYPGQKFIHIDMRPPKEDGSIYQWGIWPKRPSTK